MQWKFNLLFMLDFQTLAQNPNSSCTPTLLQVSCAVWILPINSNRMIIYTVLHLAFFLSIHMHTYTEYLMWYTIVLMYHNFFYQHAWMKIFVIFTWCYEQYWDLNHCIFSYMCRYIFCLTKYIDLYIF